MGTATNGTWRLAGSATHAGSSTLWHWNGGWLVAHTNGDWKLTVCLKEPKWAAPGATGRMGYQDDQYLYGTSSGSGAGTPTAG